VSTQLPVGSPSLLRRLNSALVLRTIRAQGPLSRSDIAKATGLSKPTVNDVVELLLGAGYVRESLADGGSRPRRPGPRARLLTFRADLGHVLGIDIGANKILVLAADLNGRTIASERRRTTREGGAAEVLGGVREAVRTVLERAGIPRSSLLAVGVGTPGVVDRAGRITLAPQLAGWEGLPLAARLGRSFSCPVLVDNEVHLSLLAERWQGAAERIDDAVYVQIGVGIGGGILIGGELYRGANGAAGEIGYLPLGDGDQSPMVGFGPFEHAAGGSAFARLGRRAAARPEGRLLVELAGGDPAAIDAEIVFQAAGRGDPAAREIVEELVARLARGIAALVVALDPATVIVGGGLSRAGSALVEPLERYVRELVPLPPRLVLSALGDESVALGAIRLAVEHVEAQVFTFAPARGGS
jgi:predicted NBD/HSP70 family sugar kinase